MFKQFKISARYTSTSDLVVSGDWASERLSFRLILTPVAGGPAIDDVGKGVHVYRRGADGAWKIALDIWNSDSAPAPAKPAK